VQRRLRDLLTVRRELAALTLAPTDARGAADRAARLQELSNRKERLEGTLARSLPELARLRAEDRASPADLAAALPAGSAFLDLYRYHLWNAKRNQWEPAHYAAFVLLSGAAVRRIELGAAEPIEKDLAAWRRAITAGRASPASARLRRRVWDQLGLPAETATVYIFPDGPLAALPWAALPGKVSGTNGTAACAARGCDRRSRHSCRPLSSRARPRGAIPPVPRPAAWSAVCAAWADV
jgi:hypothetical protein